MVEACRLDRPGIFRDCRTDDFGFRKFGALERIQIRDIFGDNDSGHASDGFAKGGHKVGGLIRMVLIHVEMRDAGHRQLGRLGCSNRVQNCVSRKRMSRVYSLTNLVELPRSSWGDEFCTIREMFAWWPPGRPCACPMRSGGCRRRRGGGPPVRATL